MKLFEKCLCAMKSLLFYSFTLLFSTRSFANEIDNKAVVKYAQPKRWETFSLQDVRLLPGSDFYRAMQIDRHYMLGMDVEKMLNSERRQSGLSIVPEPYPSSFQPANTRGGDLNHYLSAVSLMYAQTGGPEFLKRSNYIVQLLRQCYDKEQRRLAAGDSSVDRRLRNAYKSILAGRLQLNGPDEFGFPWGGFNGLGNFYYSLHKRFAALRDAYLYCNNRDALNLWIEDAELTTDFVLKANPDLFDDILDIEHGGMNEVYADLYALTGDLRYLQVSLKFNHQKVILNIANGVDNLYGRHANMQVPTFVGTARQYQLTGNDVSHRATENFLDIIFKNHESAIGGNSRYERFGRPGETTECLGYTANETCNSYNMQKVALQSFESTGNLHYMDYFERVLYNHILASQDTASGGVTYYMSLMPGGFKAFSNVYDLTGVWCCVGTGMENHSKYGEAIFFHNDKDVLLNLFIPSTLQWKEKGLSLEMQTRFPEQDTVSLTVKNNQTFDGKLLIRKPDWATSFQIWINGRKANAVVSKEGYITLQKSWKKGDKIKLVFPQRFQLEAAKDDANLMAIYHGPLLLAQPLGAAAMPGSDLVRHAHNIYKNWVPPTNDIPLLIADATKPANWIKAPATNSLHFATAPIGLLNGQYEKIDLIPFYKLQHQRQNVYFKTFSPTEWQQQKTIISDEVNTGSITDEMAHHLTGEKMDTSRFKDDSNFWENNRIGRFAAEGGWFSYSLKSNATAAKEYLVVTYWGGEKMNADFDVVMDGTVLETEQNGKRFPLTYYEEAYLLPDAVRGKSSITISFKAKPGKRAGAVYGLRLTSDTSRFRNYLFY